MDTTMESPGRLLAEQFNQGKAVVKDNCVRITTFTANLLKHHLGEVGWVVAPQGSNQTLILYFNREDARQLLIEAIPYIDGEDSILLAEKLGVVLDPFSALDEDQQQIARYWLGRMQDSDEPYLELSEMTLVGHPDTLADLVAEAYEAEDSTV